MFSKLRDQAKEAREKQKRTVSSEKDPIKATLEDVFNQSTKMAIS